MAYGSYGSLIDDYSNIRSIPAMVSAAFVLMSLYQFGGMSETTIVWIGYTLQQGHMVIGSLAAYLIAFMSSATKSFAHYRTGEQVAIVAGPVLSFGWHYIPVIEETMLMMGDPLASQVAFVVSLISWGVIVR